MRQITTQDLSQMEVINLCDGARLGYPSAVELDADGASVTALIIPYKQGFFSIGHPDTYRIPWCKLECIGEDTVLVKLTSSELSSCLCKAGKYLGFGGKM